MSVFTGKLSGAARADLELLSRQGSQFSRIADEILQRLDEQEAQLAALQQANTTLQQQALRAGIENLLLASDFDHSELSWNGGALSDDEIAFWRRGLDDAQRITTVSVSPKWDKVNGWVELNSVTNTDDLSQNFPQRILRPGVTLFFQCLARLKDAANAPSLQLEVGIWDKTAGIDKYIEGGVTGTGSATPEILKVGPGAATTNWGYKVVAIGADGSVIVSAEGTVLGAAILNATDYNQVRWQAVGGTIEYRVYRTTGGTAGRLVSITSGATSYNDQGTTLQAGEALPANNPPAAKVTFSAAALSLTTEWKLLRAEVKLPTGYNLSATDSNGQWLRLGLRGTLPAGNAVFLDRIGLSFGLGSWQPAAPDRDKAASDVVISPVGWQGLPSYAPGLTDYGGTYDIEHSQYY